MITLSALLRKDFNNLDTNSKELSQDIIREFTVKSGQTLSGVEIYLYLLTRFSQESLDYLFSIFPDADKEKLLFQILLNQEHKFNEYSTKLATSIDWPYPNRQMSLVVLAISFKRYSLAKLLINKGVNPYETFTDISEGQKWAKEKGEEAQDIFGPFLFSSSVPVMSHQLKNVRL